MLASKSLLRLGGGWICKRCRRAQLQAQQSQQHGSRRRLTTQTITSSTSSSLRDSQKLPDTPARTRFAPSPTGYLHLGSLRTALFNYLIAKATKGQFLLRIEDTDTKRTVPGAEERICSDLEWAGLQWDEGPGIGGPFGPYRQSERTALYKEYADKLLENGSAYRCFCTADRLHELAQQRAQLGLPTDYDRMCASVAKEESDERAHNGEAFTIRLRVPAFYPEYNDLVYGRVGKKQKPGSMRKNGETVYEDPILMKSDGLPTYHLANVVDDHLMEITHVVRAAEWMPSTPKHLALYEAFGWKAPKFAHVGLLQDGQGNKLSKRNADIDLESYRAKGIFPEALTNFCALLGWSHTRGDDYMKLQDLVNNFSLKFTKGNTVVTFKKLDYLQKQHGRDYVLSRGSHYEQILEDIDQALDRKATSDPNWSVVNTAGRRGLVAAILAADAPKAGYETASKFLQNHKSFFVRTIDRNAAKKPMLNDDIVKELYRQLESGTTTATWKTESVKKSLDAVAESAPFAEAIAKAVNNDNNQNSSSSIITDLRNQVAKYLRWAVLSQAGPPIAESLALLPRQTVLARLAEVGP